VIVKFRSTDYHRLKNNVQVEDVQLNDMDVSLDGAVALSSSPAYPRTNVDRPTETEDHVPTCYVRAPRLTITPDGQEDMPERSDEDTGPSDGEEDKVEDEDGVSEHSVVIMTNEEFDEKQTNHAKNIIVLETGDSAREQIYDQSDDSDDARDPTSDQSDDRVFPTTSGSECGSVESGVDEPRDRHESIIEGHNSKDTSDSNEDIDQPKSVSNRPATNHKFTISRVIDLDFDEEHTSDSEVEVDPATELAHSDRTDQSGVSDDSRDLISDQSDEHVDQNSPTGGNVQNVVDKSTEENVSNKQFDSRVGSDTRVDRETGAAIATWSDTSTCTSAADTEFGDHSPPVR